MATFPINGTGHQQITMDYNFYFTQRNAKSDGVTQAESDADAAQVKATYDDMFNATFNGNRAPLVLGNHFNSWNNNAYETALTDFVMEKCGQPEVQCVPFSDALAWMARCAPGSFELVFLDPPFEGALLEPAVAAAARIVVPQGYVYVESGEALPARADLTAYRQGRAGAVHYALLQRLNTT